MVSHPETGPDSPIGSDRDRGRDRWQEIDIEVMRTTVIKTYNSR